MFRLRLVCLLFAAFCITASDAAAQRVRGRITDQDSGLPIGGAFVILVDTSGRSLIAVLSDAAGVYHLAAPVAGTYRLRIERMGHGDTTTELLNLAAGASVTKDVAVPLDPVRLEQISASGVGRCDLPHDLGTETHTLWDEVRKALTVAHWAERQVGIPYQARLFDRTRDIVSARIEEQETRLRSGFGRAAFESAPPADLAARGYIRVLPDNVIQYFALDAAALLSDDFLDTHCFRIVRNESTHAGRVGLGFQPIEGRRLPDIQGTLWVDENTAALQYLDFTFTRHVLPVDVPPERFGGRVEFERLGNGAWVVHRWWLRMPQLPPEITVQRASDRRVAGVSASERLRIAQRRGMSIRESGGELDFIATPGAATPGAATIRGVVYDSVRSRPLVDATVFLTASGRSTMTDRYGAFEFSRVAAGDHEIAFIHPYADVLGLPVRPTRVVVPESGAANVTLAIAPIPGCDDQRDLSAARIGGFVVDADSGDGIEGAHVLAQWYRERTSDYQELHVHSASAVTAGNGAFLLCGFREGETVKLTVTAPGVEQIMEVPIEAPGLLRQTVVIRPS